MQPQTDLATTSRPPDTRDHRSASAPPRRPSSAPLDRSSLLTDLSATVSHILGLQQFHAGDAELQNRLRRTVADLELLITYLLRTDDSGSSSPPPASKPSVSTPRQRAAEHALLGWLAESTSADQLSVTDGDRSEPLARVLGELSVSRRVLPPGSAADIGLPVGTTVGHAAAELLLAVKDPAGPRCRSYRAAVYYLRDLDRDHFAWADDGRGCR